MKHSNLYLRAALCGLLAVSQLAGAAVPTEEAARLKTTLTPFGAERAGNKEGTIPAWTGGYTEVPQGYKSGAPRPDPFGAETSLFSISAKNLDKYGDKLSDGVKALLKKYPDSYRLDVYPTHRTAAAPQWVYDNTYKNATRAATTGNGIGLEGAFGGIPFPIPKDGFEAMWNHKLHWMGETTAFTAANYLVTAEGKSVLAARLNTRVQNPYYDKGGSLETFKGANQLLRIFMTDPPFKSGEQYLIVDSINKPRQAWQYLTGQRRVRKAPTIGYDTPDDVNSGQSYYDEAFVFYGDLDRYDWKLVGKREVYIPYNNSKYYQKTPVNQRLMAHHVNPDLVRWELHRVWVVEASLASGKRHVVHKRRFYLDEDTWAAVMGEGWDADGQLWRAQIQLPMIVPEGPFIYTGAQISVFNLLAGSWVSMGDTDWENSSTSSYLKLLDRLPATYFTPEAVAGEGVR